MVPSLPLLSCELSVSMKENSDREKKTLFLEKKALYCQIFKEAASDYRTMISFGLFLVVYFFWFVCWIFAWSAKYPTSHIWSAIFSLFFTIFVYLKQQRVESANVTYVKLHCVALIFNIWSTQLFSIYKKTAEIQV